MMRVGVLEIRKYPYLVIYSTAIYLFTNLLLATIFALLFPSKEYNLFYQFIPSVFAMVVLALYLMKKVGAKKLIYNRSGSNFIITAIIGVITSFLYIIIGENLFSNTMRQEINALSSYGYVVIAIFICIFGPVSEEIIFRGYIFESACIKYGATIAWAINILASIASHYFIGPYKNTIPTITYFVGGVCIFTLTYRYGGLYSSMLVHGFINYYGFVHVHDVQP